MATPTAPATPEVEVVQYSDLDDIVYLQWRGPEDSGTLAAIPRREALAQDPSGLCDRLRLLGLPLPTELDGPLARRVKRECSRRFPTLR